MTNTNLLKFKLAENNLTQKAIAEKIGLASTTFCKKLNNTNNEKFSIPQVKEIKELLNLSAEEVEMIFFS